MEGFDLQWIRPLWLWGMLPCLIIAWVALRHTRLQRSWHQVIDATLAPYLLPNQAQSARKTWLLWSILCAWLIACIALAGPSLQQRPQTLSKNQDALVIMLDLSLSMAAQDVSPSRYERALHKISDVLSARRDGLTALVVYAGSAHSVTPLTDDHNTIRLLLPSLSPFMMPTPGSRPDLAIELAQALVTNAGLQQAQLLWLTDGVQAADTSRIQEVWQRHAFPLGMIAIGSNEPVPIPLPNGDYLRDAQNLMITTTLDRSAISQLSQRLSVPWQPLTLGDQDWQSLLERQQQSLSKAHSEQMTLRIDQGYWLIPVLMVFLLGLFRRGVLASISLPLSASILISLLAVAPQSAQASPWRTPDQQGAALFEQDPAQAATEFNNPLWKAAALYRSGQYDEAAKLFESAPKNATNQYNLGNALAQAGRLDEAVKAYENALALEPDFTAAQRNLEQVKQAIEQTPPSPHHANQDHSDGKEGTDSSEGEQRSQGDASPNDNAQQDNAQSSDADHSARSDASREQTNASSDETASAAKDQRSSAQNQTAEQPDPQALAQQAERDRAQEQDKQPLAASDDTETNTDQHPPEDEAAHEATDSTLSTARANREQEETMQHRLQRLPETRGNLLQNKFLYESRKRAAPRQDEDVLW